MVTFCSRTEGISDSRTSDPGPPRRGVELGAHGRGGPPPSDELLARALAEPERLVAHDPSYAKGAQR
ncbi:hypothetical protein, partial [Streptomyces spectabilis]|uniref:hypothetical protein n=1 Tax=Streptomyces spectabilis TaxID=68270 RepID=UPI0033EC0C4E